MRGDGVHDVAVNVPAADRRAELQVAQVAGDGAGVVGLLRVDPKVRTIMTCIWRFVSPLNWIFGNEEGRAGCWLPGQTGPVAEHVVNGDALGVLGIGQDKVIGEELGDGRVKRDVGVLGVVFDEYGDGDGG